MKKLIAVAAILFLSIHLIAQTRDTSFERYMQAIPSSNVKFEMVPIPAGMFKLGNPPGDVSGDMDEQPQVTVHIDAFWMGAREVTYDEYAIYLQDQQVSQNSDADAITRPSTPYIDLTLGMGKQGGYPANSMQQRAAIMYCKWLYQKTGVFYRLPTEAEWEYASRAGSSTPYFFGSDSSLLYEYAWYSKNSGNQYQKTGLKKPNPWGLYDILGNVAEWVLDQYQENFYKTLKENVQNPLRMPEAKYPRVVRGGSYRDNAAELRSANRVKSDLAWNQRDPQIPKSKWWNADAPFVGFRLVRPFRQPSTDEVNKFFDSFIL